METDYISMSPGHELVPVHGMRDMSLGHIDTFAFGIKTPPRMSWRLDGDWLYFRVPGHELVAVHGMRDMSLGHSDTFTFCIRTSYVVAPGWRLKIVPFPPWNLLNPVHDMRNMSLGHIDTFTFGIKTPSMSWRLDGGWLYFHVFETWISSCSWHAWYVPGTYQHIYIL